MASRDIELYRAVKAKVEEYKSIVIFRKDNPDADAYGSQLGLKALLTLNYPDKEIYAVGDNSDYLNPIGRMDSFDEPDYKNSLGIIVDAAAPEWIDGEQWKECKEVIKIDDHPEMSDYGIIQIEDDSMSTCCELIAQLSFDNEWKFDQEASRCFILGILDGTSYFRANNINKHTFVILGRLLEINPDLSDVFNSMDMVTDGEIKLKKFIVNHFKRTIGNTTYLYIPKAKLDSYGVEPNRATAFIWLLLDMSQGEFTVMFTEYAKDKIRVQFRSKTRPVNVFAAKYGGWGTQYSAGAFLNSKKQVREVLDTLDNETI